MKWPFFFLIFFFPILASGTESSSRIDDPLERRLAYEEPGYDNPWVFVPHRMNYILPFTAVKNINDKPFRQANDNTDFDHLESKFQISFKFPVWKRVLYDDGILFFGYTQLALWQSMNRNESTPIRETNYEPEIFYSLKTDTDVLSFTNRIFRVGLSHQSNGRGSSALSRSWNRLWANFTLTRDMVVIDFKPWIRIPEATNRDDNPHIERYVGYGEIRLGFSINDYVISALVRNNFKADENKGALELGVSFPLNRRIKAYIQYFTGYGETLLDYNFPVDRIGVGLLLADWI